MWEPPKAFEHHAKCMFESKQHATKAIKFVKEIQSLPSDSAKLEALRVRANYHNVQMHKWQAEGLSTFKMERDLREKNG